MQNRRTKRIPNDKFLEVRRLNTPVCRHDWVTRRSIDNPLDATTLCRKCGKIGNAKDAMAQDYFSRKIIPAAGRMIYGTRR